MDQKRPPRVAFRLLRESGTLKTEAAFLMTECKTERYEFHALGSRDVVGHFDGGDITSDAGGLLLREVEKRTGDSGHAFRTVAIRDSRNSRLRNWWGNGF